GRDARGPAAGPGVARRETASIVDAYHCDGSGRRRAAVCPGDCRGAIAADLATLRFSRRRAWFPAAAYAALRVAHRARGLAEPAGAGAPARGAHGIGQSAFFGVVAAAGWMDGSRPARGAGGAGCRVGPDARRRPAPGTGGGATGAR